MSTTRTMRSCEYGKKIRKRLIDLEKTQNWLIGEVKALTGLSFDCGYLQKILSGKNSPPRIVAAINEILEFSAESAGSEEAQ